MNFAQSNRFFGLGGGFRFRKKFSVGKASAGLSDGGSVLLSLTPAVLKILREGNDDKVCLGKSRIDCLINLRISTLQIQSPDPKSLAGSNGRVVSLPKPSLQQIHSLRYMSNVFTHRPNRIHDYRLDRINASQRNETVRRL